MILNFAELIDFYKTKNHASLNLKIKEMLKNSKLKKTSEWGTVNLPQMTEK